MNRTVSYGHSLILMGVRGGIAAHHRWSMIITVLSHFPVGYAVGWPMTGVISFSQQSSSGKSLTVWLLWSCRSDIIRFSSRHLEVKMVPLHQKKRGHHHRCWDQIASKTMGFADHIRCWERLVDHSYHWETQQQVRHNTYRIRHSVSVVATPRYQ